MAGRPHQVYPSDVGDSPFYFWQWSFALTATSIVSGSVAERCKLKSYLLFCLIISSFIYPIAAHWSWSSNSWLQELFNYHDFAGCGVVHMVGGLCGLVGAIFLGPRLGRFEVSQSARRPLLSLGRFGAIMWYPPKPNPLPAHNAVLSTIGCMFLWFGWYGFNGSSAPLISSVGGIAFVAKALNMTTLSASAGGITVWILGYLFPSYTSGVEDLPLLLNGVLAGLVSVTAGADCVTAGGALLCGSIGAAIYIALSGLTSRLGVDDPLDAFPLHAGCGLWGLLAVGLFSDGKNETKNTSLIWTQDGGEQLKAQLVGALVIGLWSIGTGVVAFFVIDKLSRSARVPPAAELSGLDEAYHGGGAYPEFAKDEGPPIMDVAFVMCNVEGWSSLCQWDRGLMDNCLVIYKSVIKTCLEANKGYEISLEKSEGAFAFHCATDAARFCNSVQLQLMQIVWPSELLVHPKAGVVFSRDVDDGDVASAHELVEVAMAEPPTTAAAVAPSPSVRASPSRRFSFASPLSPRARSKSGGDGSNFSGSSQNAVKKTVTSKSTNGHKVFHGLRVRMAVDHGRCDRYLDDATGKFAYSGDCVSNCRCIFQAIQSGGHVVASDNFVEKLNEENGLTPEESGARIHIGTHVLEGSLGQSAKLTQLIPPGLSRRELLPLRSIRMTAASFFEAPAAVVPRGEPIPPVTIALLVVSLNSRKVDKAVHRDRSLIFFRTLLRMNIQLNGGHMCSEPELPGSPLAIAFRNPEQACSWALAMRLSVRHTSQARQRYSKVISDSWTSLTFSVGIHTAVPSVVVPNLKTGYPEYIGGGLVQGALSAIAAAPNAGAVLLTSAAHRALDLSPDTPHRTLKFSSIEVAADSTYEELEFPADIESTFLIVKFVSWAHPDLAIAETAREWSKTKADSSVGEFSNDGRKASPVPFMPLVDSPKFSLDDGLHKGITRSISTETTKTMSKSELTRRQSIIDEVFNSSPLLASWQIGENDIDLKGSTYVASGASSEVRSVYFRGSLVAVKVLKPDKFDHERCMSFRSELLLSRDLRHRNILQILGANWSSPSQVYLVMEYCEKGSLSTVLRREGSTLKLMGTKLRWLIQVAKAMAYLHGFVPKLIHRDLKGDNVLLNSSLDCKLGDFGESCKLTDGNLTSVGSPFFVAPEVFNGKRYDESCDVYSFSIFVLEVMANGNLKVLFQSRDNSKSGRPTVGLALAAKAASGWRPQLPTSLTAKAPRLCNLVKQCWSQEANLRPDFSTILVELKGIFRSANWEADTEGALKITDVRESSLKNDGTRIIPTPLFPQPVEGRGGGSGDRLGAGPGGERRPIPPSAVQNFSLLSAREWDQIRRQRRLEEVEAAKQKREYEIQQYRQYLATLVPGAIAAGGGGMPTGIGAEPDRKRSVVQDRPGMPKRSQSANMLAPPTIPESESEEKDEGTSPLGASPSKENSTREIGGGGLGGLKRSTSVGGSSGSQLFELVNLEAAANVEGQESARGEKVLDDINPHSEPPPSAISALSPLGGRKKPPPIITTDLKPLQPSSVDSSDSDRGGVHDASSRDSSLDGGFGPPSCSAAMVSGGSSEDDELGVSYSKARRRATKTVVSTEDGSEIKGLAAIHYLSEKYREGVGARGAELVVSEEDDVGLDFGPPVDFNRINFEMNHDSLNDRGGAYREGDVDYRTFS